MKTSMRNVVLLIGLLMLGCSQEWRTGDQSIDPNTVKSDWQAFESATASSDATASSIATQIVSSSSNTLYEDPDTTVFYANACPDPESNGCMGPITGILAVDNLDFLGAGALTIAQVKSAKIFFLDSPSTTDRLDGLVIGIADGSGNYNYYGFQGTDASVHGGVFSVDLQGTAGSITLESDDTDGDDLESVIQLKIFVDGEMVGKISTLTGYSP